MYQPPVDDRTRPLITPRGCAELCDPAMSQLDAPCRTLRAGGSKPRVIESEEPSPRRERCLRHPNVLIHVAQYPCQRPASNHLAGSSVS